MSVAVIAFVTCVTAQGANEDLSGIEFFEKRIRPLLVEKCYRCHSSDSKKVRGGVLLDTRAGWLRGGDRGPSIVPGIPDESLLIEAVEYTNVDLQMPPKGKLSGKEIADLRQWVKLGAPDPRVGEAARGLEEEFDLGKRRSQHWAWQPISSPTPPAVQTRAWPRAPLDHFVLARLEALELHPAVEADRRTLIRRVTFDLIGLPPTPAEVSAFVRDDSVGAFEKVVDRLLHSPQFGEHWGQHWLDLMRFAETKGHEGDYTIEGAYHYRDYVVRAFNDDVPYDEFLVEHVAGDLVDKPRIDSFFKTNDSILGTGFWHLGEAAHSPVDIRGEEADRVANQIDVFSRSFLALTVGCARCHAHKFDAISHEDYYAFAGYLQSSSFHYADVSDPQAHSQARNELVALKAERFPEIQAAYADALRQQLADMSSYLMAAGSIVPHAKRAPPPSQEKDGRKREEGETGEGKESSPFERETDAAIEQVAAVAELDGSRLTNWLLVLLDASEDVRHPLFPFAVAARHSGTETVNLVRSPSEEIALRFSDEMSVSQKDFAEQKTVTTVEQGERNYVSTERPLRPEDLLWAKPPEGNDWLVYGERFGSGPGRAGDVVVGRRAEEAVTRILEDDAVASNLVTDRLTGMIRTRTFEVTSNTLWYRYSGQADVFMAVDSHRTVLGPLHKVVKQQLRGGSGNHWHAHVVKDYVGHRVHVEFTPVGDFSVSRIQFAAATPVEIFEPVPRIAELAASAPADSLKEWAKGYVALFEDVTEVLKPSGQGVEFTASQRYDARLVNWLLRHRSLLQPMRGGFKDRLVKLFEPYQKQRDVIDATVPKSTRAPILIDGSGENEFLHLRGNHKTLAKERTARRILSALGGEGVPQGEPRSGRLAMARRLTHPSNPLVSRVLVNRLWHHVFGRGIVPTVDDFGEMGQEPSHPELLDHLGGQLIADGWSIKLLLRRILLSSTYRMASRAHPSARDQVDTLDPTNKWLHRMPIRRLRGEAIRDALLVLSGRLVSEMHGEGVMVHITPFMRHNRSPAGSGPVDSDGRRSIYIEVRRNHLSHFLTTFDKPIPFTTIGRRTVSNSPAQPLVLLNDPFVHQQVRLCAERLLAQEGKSDAELVEELYVKVFSRPPTVWEREAALSFFRGQEGSDDDREARVRAWSDLCHTLVNVKEFIFLN